tara:strand:+ start:6148 stop:6390 length:243 start_codon:yes stop_codon:yes gene_type:complete
MSPEVWSEAGVAGLAMLAIITVVLAHAKNTAAKDKLFVKSLKETRRDDQSERSIDRLCQRESQDKLSKAIDGLADSLKKD